MIINMTSQRRDDDGIAVTCTNQNAFQEPRLMRGRVSIAAWIRHMRSRSPGKHGQASRRPGVQASDSDALSTLPSCSWRSSSWVAHSRNPDFAEVDKVVLSERVQVGGRIGVQYCTTPAGVVSIWYLGAVMWSVSKHDSSVEIASWAKVGGRQLQKHTSMEFRSTVVSI